MTGVGGVEPRPYEISIEVLHAGEGGQEIIRAAKAMKILRVGNFFGE